MANARIEPFLKPKTKQIACSGAPLHRWRFAASCVRLTYRRPEKAFISLLTMYSRSDQCGNTRD